jgi:profilin
VWATSAGFVVSPAEIKEIVGAYKDKADVKQVQSSGLHIAGEKYVVLRADDRSIYGKKVCSTVWPWEIWLNAMA